MAFLTLEALGSLRLPHTVSALRLVQRSCLPMKSGPWVGSRDSFEAFNKMEKNVNQTNIIFSIKDFPLCSWIQQPKAEKWKMDYLFPHRLYVPSIADSKLKILGWWERWEMDDSVPPNKESATEMEGWSDPALWGVVFRPFPTRQDSRCEQQGLPISSPKSLYTSDKMSTWQFCREKKKVSSSS